MTEQELQLRYNIEKDNNSDQKMIEFYLRLTCGELRKQLSTALPEEDSGQRETILDVCRSLQQIQEGKNLHEYARQYEIAIETRNKLLRTS